MERYVSMNKGLIYCCVGIAQRQNRNRFSVTRDKRRTKSQNRGERWSKQMEGKLTPGVGVQICAPGAHFAKRKMGGDGDSKYHAGWGSGLADWRCWGTCCLGVDDVGEGAAWGLTMGLHFLPRWGEKRRRRRGNTKSTDDFIHS